jgi:hypothetical protein
VRPPPPIWPGTGAPGEVSSIDQTEDFLTAYQEASGKSCTDHEIGAAWAVGLWTRAFDGKKASLAGADPDAALTRTKAAQRGRLAGL